MQTEARKQEVEKMLEELEQYCYRHHLACFASVAVGEDEYNTHMVSAEIAGQELKNDLIAKYVCVMRGFDVVPHNEPIMMELLTDETELEIEDEN